MSEASDFIDADGRPKPQDPILELSSAVIALSGAMQLLLPLLQDAEAARRAAALVNMSNAACDRVLSNLERERNRG